MKPKDWVALIEAAYNLEQTEELWLKQVLDQAAPLFDRGFWPTTWTYDVTPTTIQLREIATKGPAKAKSFIHESLKSPAHIVDFVYRHGLPIDAMSDWFVEWPELREYVRRGTGGIVRDALAIKAPTGQGRGLGLTNLAMKKITPTALELKRWPFMTSHLAAGLRLRGLTERLSLNTAPVEGIFDPSGKMLEAREHATQASSRDTLRDAVRRIDQLRTRAGRSDPDEAMMQWEGLVDGRWSLVDHFDSDQRRFVVAIRNDPAFPDPRGLTLRERQVAEFIGLGQSTKQISYTLGVSQSAVSNCTARAQHKLGMSSLPELAAFFAPGGLRAKLAEVSVDGESLLLGAYPLINEDKIQNLTESERAVLAHVVAGSTNSDIAKKRNASEYTVANQIKSVFAKLNVRSRSELAARLQSVA